MIKTQSFPKHNLFEPARQELCDSQKGIHDTSKYQLRPGHYSWKRWLLAWHSLAAKVAEIILFDKQDIIKYY